MVDIDKIKWRVVSEEEYGQSHFQTPRRITRFNFDESFVYELGEKPIQLPTKPGAIVAPVAPNNYHFVPYVLSPNGSWYEMENDVDPYTVEADEIIEFIEEGSFYIAYGGYDD